MPDPNAVLKIYGDDKVLYTSDPLQPGTLPIDFNVNISGVKKLKLEVSQTQQSASILDIYFGIVNAKFSK